MELLIDKKYLIRLEKYTKFGYRGSYDPWACRYVFKLPPNAGLPDGYTVYIEAHRVEWERDEKSRVRPWSSKPLYTDELENNRTYRLDRESDAVYVATMTENREEGKRYKQYKYTAEELYALYQNVDLKTAELAVAKIDIYIEGQEGNRHKALHGNRIERTDYYVGKVQGCWFYCSELDTKRRIGSHGVTILGNIKAENEAAAWQLIRQTQKKIKQCKESCTCIHIARSSIDKAWREVNYYCDEKNTNAPKDEEVLNAIRAVRSDAEKAIQLIDKKLSEEDAEILEIQTELEEQLKKLYKKEV